MTVNAVEDRTEAEKMYFSEIILYAKKQNVIRKVSLSHDISLR